MVDHDLPHLSQKSADPFSLSQKGCNPVAAREFTVGMYMCCTVNKNLATCLSTVHALQKILLETKSLSLHQAVFDKLLYAPSTPR